MTITAINQGAIELLVSLVSGVADVCASNASFSSRRYNGGAMLV